MLTVEQQLIEVEQLGQAVDTTIPTPEEINQQYELAEAYDRFVEIWGHHVVADPLTGEIVNIFDPNIPVHQKADAIQWVLAKLENEQKMCGERKRLWSNKSKKFQIVIRKIRTTVLLQMKQEGTQKIKTPENTFSIASHINITYDYNKIPLENRKVRIIEECSMREALEMGYTTDQMEFIGAVHPEDVSPDAIVKQENEYLVIRTKK